MDDKGAMHYSMNKRIFASAALAGAMLLLTACSFEAPAPQRTAPPPTPPPPLSTLSVTLSIPAADIARVLNDKTAAHIADLRDQPVNCGIGRCKLTLDATRTGAIAVDARDNALQIAVPFSTNAELAMPGFLSVVKANVNASGKVVATATASIGPSWKLLTATSGTVQLQNGHLRLGPLVTNLADVWNNNEDLLSRPLFKLFDQQIAAGLHADTRIAELWASAFTPIKVGKTPVTWMLLQPERIRVGKPVTADGALILSLGVDVRARLIAQDEQPKSEPTQLPPPAPLKGPVNRFIFSAPVLLPYDRAARLALDALKKNPPRVGSHGLRITKFEIIPSGQDVILATSFCVDQNWDPTELLSGCGSGYLRGTPTFDPATQTIRIVNVHYDIETQNVMLRAMRALSGAELGRDFEKRLVFNVSKDIAKLQSQIAAAAAKPQGRDLTILGKVEAFGPVSLTWTKDGFLASFSVQGSVHAELHI